MLSASTRGLWSGSLPKLGLKYSDAERGPVDKLGGLPPLRFLPKIEREESESSVAPSTCTIKIGESDKSTYTQFTGVDATFEDAIKHIELFGSIAKKKEYNSDAKAWAEIIRDCQSTLASYGAPPAPGEPDGPGEADEERDGITRTKRQWLEIEIEEARQAREEAIKGYWALWEKLLSPTLMNKWHEIVRHECETAGYIAKNGVKKTGKRGKSIAAHWYCRRAWLLTIVAPNAAERHRMYMMAQIIKPKQITAEQFVNRMVELNNYLPLLPCWKDEENSPEALTRADVPFPPIEMCMIIINALPFALASAYWAMKGAKHCPIDVEELKKDLMLVEPNVNRFAKLTEQVRKVGGKIPAKEQQGKSSDKGKSGRGDAAEAGSGKNNNKNNNNKGNKLCQRCASGAPQIKHTHNTNECRKFHADGTPKQPRGGRGKHSNAHSKEEVAEMKESFATLRKENKKIMKLLAKAKSKGKKRKRHYDSDSDASTDSDDE